MEFDFAKNLAVKDINVVPQDFRGLYVKQDDDSYKLDSDNAGVKSAISAITGLNTALVAARKEAKDKTPVDLTPLKAFGDNPTAIAAAVKNQIEELQQQVTKDGDAKLNLDKIKQDLAVAHAGDLKNKDSRIGALSQQLYGLLVTNAATGAIAAEKGSVELLMPFVERQVKVVEKDGEVGVFVVDTAGDQRYSGVTGQPMTVKELVVEMKGNETYGKLFDSAAPQGGGSSSDASSRSSSRKQGDGDTRTPVNKISDGLKKIQK